MNNTLGCCSLDVPLLLLDLAVLLAPAQEQLVLVIATTLPVELAAWTLINLQFFFSTICTGTSWRVCCATCFTHMCQGVMVSAMPCGLLVVR